ncbi:Crp/Fnr family transcriptional regulator [Plebeiibacterium sediminum]|uniref:Crp/Fnr family transcriptional regulator n=1 Tax=Plebeiibacterium sediminum TaxID=2992112 RepID=A0AAE3SEL4_9BACT|nr:Crp/Fnr family transcriptional regulator [Plebeiobacterium sediminum]MCW3786137.1 Crp/Fnr family transcriptional regulator [Plebeiobacterium sediminum]
MNQECSCDKCELKELFFHNVTSKEIMSLCGSRVEKNYDKGDCIIEQGTTINEFIYLKSGLVKLYVTNTDGKEQILSFAKPFDFVSLLSVFSQNTYSYSVMAIDESTTCNISIHDVKKLLQNNGPFAMGILEKMSKVSDAVINESLQIRKRNLRGRIAYVLLHFRNDIYNSDYYELPVSRKEIAEYIGMTTENVIRALTEFRKDGIIKIFGKAIEIVSYKKLVQISEHG